MYGRSVQGRELTFEPSGALMNASLVMRDRETDSWWSIMTSDAVGGPLEGTGLHEMPVSRKATWGDWRRRHPDTRVLSVDGREHVESDPYESYFTSDGTFRGLEVADDRLPPKAPIYSFHLEGRAYAVPHPAVEGGALFELGDGRVAYLHREPGSSFFASTDAWLLPADAAAELDGAEAVEEWLSSGSAEGARRLGGFDTYWYTWVGVHEDTELLR